ncbi:MAG: DNA alkylation repair protein [FCB group bacterium]|nr:DNA alkylation repair protein [FCB group bacterium]
MDFDNQITDITARLETLGDADRREKAKTYHPTKMRVIGVKIPDLRPVIKEYSAKFKKSPPEEVIAFAKALVDTDIFECHGFAYELLSRNKRALASLTLEEVEYLGKCLDNWGLVDAYACLVAGRVWREGRIPDELIIDWAKSPDRWLRRTAVVCTVPFNQKTGGGTGNKEKTLMICRIVADDQDDMVAKALSWALRKLSGFEPAAVRDFIEEYRQVLPKRVIREVEHKLTTGKKN